MRRATPLTDPPSLLPSPTPFAGTLFRVPSHPPSQVPFSEFLHTLKSNEMQSVELEADNGSRIIFTPRCACPHYWWRSTGPEIAIHETNLYLYRMSGLIAVLLWMLQSWPRARSRFQRGTRCDLVTRLTWTEEYPLVRSCIPHSPDHTTVTLRRCTSASHSNLRITDCPTRPWRRTWSGSALRSKGRIKS